MLECLRRPLTSRNPRLMWQNKFIDAGDTTGLQML
ncbi:unnamed protein product [Tenebrio molitor]|nr:unnamed protein product [Tenebrio molitor]